MVKSLKDHFMKRNFKKTKNTTEEYIIEKMIKTKNNKIDVKWRI